MPVDFRVSIAADTARRQDHRGDAGRDRRSRRCRRRARAQGSACRARHATSVPKWTTSQLLDIPIEVLDVMVTSKSVIGKTMAELARLEYANGVFVRKIMRTGTGASDHRDDAHRPRRPAAPDRHQAESRTRGQGNRLSRSSDNGDGHGFRRHRHRARRTRRRAFGHRRRHPADVDRQRRRTDHGARVRLAALGVSVLRPHSRAGDLDLRHARIVRFHRRRRAQCRPHASLRG